MSLLYCYQAQQHLSLNRNLLHQLNHSSQTLVSLILLEHFTTQEPLKWIQMLSSGKELPSMMVRYTERKTSKVMQMNSRHILRNRRLLLMLESHTSQHFSKPNKWILMKMLSLLPVRHSKLLDKYHWTSNSLTPRTTTTLMMTSLRMRTHRPSKLPLMFHVISDLFTSKIVMVNWWNKNQSI